MTDTITLAKQCGAIDRTGDLYSYKHISLSVEQLEAFRQACVKEAVPAGHKVVPVEPSRDQLVAAQAAECATAENAEEDTKPCSQQRRR